MDCTDPRTLCKGKHGWIGLLGILAFPLASIASPQEDAIRKAAGLVAKSAGSYIEKRDCISCHHQSLPMWALGQAGFGKGLPAQKEYIEDYFEGRLEQMAKGQRVIGGPYTAGYALAGMAESGGKPSPTTDALVQYLRHSQHKDGSWRIRTHRPPLEDSHFTATALAIRGMLAYGKPKDGVVKAAKTWLLTNNPTSTEDYVFQVLGVHWAGSKVEPHGQELLRLQREDGGWGQLPSMESDAYATGMSLFALRETGIIETSDCAYESGVKWLLDHQQVDGSWHVRSRSKPIQQYFDSGFPHGKDQFISIAATCWAILALH